MAELAKPNKQTMLVDVLLWAETTLTAGRAADREALTQPPPRIASTLQHMWDIGLTEWKSIASKIAYDLGTFEYEYVNLRRFGV